MKSNKNLVTNIGLRWRLVAVSIIIFALIAFIVSSLIPVKYESNISMIVIQKQSTEKIDAFSAAKSAEFLTNVFSKVIYTTSFFNAVQESSFDVKKDFAVEAKKREKEWKKMVNVNSVNNTSIINIEVMDDSRFAAEEMASAIAHILTTNGNKYHGGGDRVEVRLIDGPNTPISPIFPNIPLNLIMGALLGGIIASTFVYYFPGKLLLSKREYYLQSEINDVQEGSNISHFQDAQSESELERKIAELKRASGNFYNYDERA